MITKAEIYDRVYMFVDKYNLKPYEKMVDEFFTVYFDQYCYSYWKLMRIEILRGREIPDVAGILTDALEVADSVLESHIKSYIRRNGLEE